MGLLKRGGGVYRMDNEEAERLAELLGNKVPLSVQLLSSAGTSMQISGRRLGRAPGGLSAGVPLSGNVRPTRVSSSGKRVGFEEEGAGRAVEGGAGTASAQRSAPSQSGQGQREATVEDAVSAAAARNTPPKRVVRPMSAPAPRYWGLGPLPGEGGDGPVQLSFVPQRPEVVREVSAKRPASGTIAAYPMVRPVGTRARAAKGQAVSASYRQPFVPPREDDPFPMNDHERDVKFEEALRRATVSAMGTGVSRNYRSRSLHLHVALKEMLKDVERGSSGRPGELAQNRLSCARVAFRELIASNHTLGPLLFELKDIYEASISTARPEGENSEVPSEAWSPSPRSSPPRGVPSPRPEGAPHSTARAEWSPGGTRCARGDRPGEFPEYEFPSSSTEPEAKELDALREEVGRRVEEVAEGFKERRDWDVAAAQVQDLVEEFGRQLEDARARLEQALAGEEAAKDQARKSEVAMTAAKEKARLHELENDLLRIEVRRLREAIKYQRASTAGVARAGIGEHHPRPQSARTWSDNDPQVSFRAGVPEGENPEDIRLEGEAPFGSFYLADRYCARPADRFQKGKVPPLVFTRGDEED